MSEETKAFKGVAQAACLRIVSETTVPKTPEEKAEAKEHNASCRRVAAADEALRRAEWRVTAIKRSMAEGQLVEREVECLLGETLKEIEGCKKDSKNIIFRAQPVKEFNMRPNSPSRDDWHCFIDEVVGDIQFVMWMPITEVDVVKEKSNSIHMSRMSVRLSTERGSVTIRWLATFNDYNEDDGEDDDDGGDVTFDFEFTELVFPGHKDWKAAGTKGGQWGEPWA